MGKYEPPSRLGEDIAIFRIVKVTQDGTQFLCRAYSISDDAIKLLTGVELRVGTRLSIELSGTVRFDVTVAEYSGVRATLRFDRRIDVGATLRRTSRALSSTEERPARVPVDQHCAAYTPVGIRYCTTVDVSQCGLKLKHAGFLLPGMKITLSLPIGRKTGMVRWVSEDLAGVQLLDCLTLEEIEALKQLETRH